MKMIAGSLLLMRVAACSKSSVRTTADTAPTTHDTATGAMAMPSMSDTAGKGGMNGMSGMGGMGGMTNTVMIDSMETHMRMMDTMSATTLRAMLPIHRQMMGNMIAQMNSDMRGMKMMADARWMALMDSVRQDLVRMPDMNAQQLKSFMPAHRRRVVLLLQLHGGMMAEKQK